MSSCCTTDSQQMDRHSPHVASSHLPCAFTAAKDLRNFARAYIVDQLKRHGHARAATELGSFEIPSDVALSCLHKIADQVAQERREQLEEICFELQISKDNVKETFDTMVDEIFADEIKWGRIVTFIAFSGALAGYCADHRLKDLIQNIIQWTESVMQNQLAGWITSHGGWEAFLDHFDTARSSCYFPRLFMGVGLATLAVLGGLIMFRNKRASSLVFL